MTMVLAPDKRAQADWARRRAEEREAAGEEATDGPGAERLAQVPGGDGSKQNGRG
jgi:hypothetical protein